jgi:hypothetical protein
MFIGATVLAVTCVNLMVIFGYAGIDDVALTAFDSIKYPSLLLQLY